MIEQLFGPFAALAVQSAVAPRLAEPPECKFDQINQSIEQADRPHSEGVSSSPIPVCEERWRWQIWANPPSHLALIGLHEPFAAEVEVLVTVEVNGRVSDCVSSLVKEAKSKDPSRQETVNRRFTETACHGMRRYSRFKPSLDSSGTPIVSRYKTVIEYSY